MADRVNAETFQGRVLDAAGAVLVDFYSDSCVTCKRLTPQLSRFEAAFGRDVDVVKVNTRYDADLAGRYEVAATPTLVLFSGGAELARSTGFMTLDQLEEFVTKGLQR